MVLVKLQRLLGLGAREELEVPHNHHHCHLKSTMITIDNVFVQDRGHLQFQKSEAHPKASPWTLTKPLKGVRGPEMF